MKAREFKVDFLRPDYRNIFNITQYNVNNPIKISLLEDGQPYIIPAGAIVKVEVSIKSKKENVAVIITNATVGDNYVIVNNPREMCLCNGDGALQVRIEYDDYVYITPQIRFKVLEAVISEDTVIKDLIVTEKEELEELLSKINEKIGSSSLALKQFIISGSMWKYDSTLGGYTYTIKHNLNSYILVGTSYTEDRISVDLPFKIIDKNTVQLMSMDDKKYYFCLTANIIEGGN